MGSEEQVDPQDEALALLALSLEPQRPPAALRGRIMASVTGRGRYLGFASALADELDLSLARTRELLESAASEGPWQKGLIPGFAIIHFQAGPAIVERHAGFAKMPAGFEIPAHRHRVEELTFVMEGLIVDDQGTLVGPGEQLRSPAGTVHSMSVVEDAVVVSLVGAVEAVDVGDVGDVTAT